MSHNVNIGFGDSSEKNFAAIITRMSWEFRYNTGETPIHRRCKAAIFEAFLGAPNVSDVKLERYLGEVRPDISAVVKRRPCGSRVQSAIFRLKP